MTELAKFDEWLDDNGPAALVIRDHLIPVEGADGVFFPATYAAQVGADRDKEKFQGGYNIDEFPDGTNVCLVDSVGSQANRLEPIFSQQGYDDLVPQIVVTFPTKGIRLNLLHANHRAADAIVRCSAFEAQLRAAFQERLRGNFEPLAKLAPTSLVFGVWDSRDTSAKVPRLIASTIRAFNVHKHTRSANFLTQMTVDLAALDILPDAGSKEGFANALASKAPGGVQLMANGSIRRDVTVALSALRRLVALEANGSIATERTKALQRYILGLSLVALTSPLDPFLRQGCNLVPDTDKPREFKLVKVDGERPDFVLAHSDAVKYAREAMGKFGIQSNDEQPFDISVAEKASEVKPEKLNGAEVLSTDPVAKSFKVRFKQKEYEVRTTGDTVIKKGKEQSEFEGVVVAGSKLNLEILNGIAVSITSKK